MSILNKRNYFVERYRVYVPTDKYEHKIYQTSWLIAHAAIIYHSVCNLFSHDVIRCRIIGSYVR